MTIYNIGTVLLVPFPFTDQSTFKKRPAVIISSEQYNQVKDDVIIIGITSQIKHPLKLGEILIEQWSQAGLLKPSLIKPILTTIEKSLIQRIRQLCGTVATVSKIVPPSFRGVE